MWLQIHKMLVDIKITPISMKITIYFLLHLITFAFLSSLIYLLIFMFCYFYQEYELQIRINGVGYGRDCTTGHLYLSLDFVKNNHCFALFECMHSPWIRIFIMLPPKQQYMYQSAGNLVERFKVQCWLTPR